MHIALVCWYHILDVDEGIRSTTVFQDVQRVLDNIAYTIVSIYINACSKIYIDIFVEIACG